jgi:hypothetical protein
MGQANSGQQVCIFSFFLFLNLDVYKNILNEKFE